MLNHIQNKQFTSTELHNLKYLIEKDGEIILFKTDENIDDVNIWVEISSLYKHSIPYKLNRNKTIDKSFNKEEDKIQKIISTIALKINKIQNINIITKKKRINIYLIQNIQNDVNVKKPSILYLNKDGIVISRNINCYEVICKIESPAIISNEFELIFNGYLHKHRESYATIRFDNYIIFEKLEL